MKTLLLVSLVALLGCEVSFAADTHEPQTLVELNRWYEEPPAGQNAAALYLKGFTDLHISEADKASADLPLIGKAKLPDGDKPMPARMRAAIAEFTDNNRAAVGIFIEAAKHEQSRYPIDLTQGQATLLPHLSKIKSAAQILELSALSHAVANEGEMAGKGILTGLALAQSLESEPTLISQLVRVACVNIAVNGLEQVLNRAVLPPEFLGRLEKVIWSLEKREALGVGFTRGLISERVIGLSKFNMAPEGYLKVPDNATPAEREKLILQIKQTLAADRQLFESTFAKVPAIRIKPFPFRLKQSEIFLQGATQATNKHLLLCCMLLPALDKISS